MMVPVEESRVVNHMRPPMHHLISFWLSKWMVILMVILDLANGEDLATILVLKKLIKYIKNSTFWQIQGEIRANDGQMLNHGLYGINESFICVPNEGSDGVKNG